MPEFLTAKDLEAVLKIDAKTIYSYVRRGLIPYVRIQRNVRFSASKSTPSDLLKVGADSPITFLMAAHSPVFCLFD
jgi:predicted site-specific integrase-resolvase